MTHVTMTFGGKDYQVDRSPQDGKINMTTFAKDNPDLRPHKVVKMAIKGWIDKETKGSPDLYRRGDTPQTHLVHESIWERWIGQSVGPTPSPESQRCGLDEETRNWISRLVDGLKGWASDLFNRHEARLLTNEGAIARQVTENDKIHDWLDQHDTRIDQKADNLRVAKVEEENKDLRARMIILERRLKAIEDSGGDGGKGKGKGWRPF